MKKLLSGLVGVSLFSLLLITTNSQKAYAQDVTVSYQDFYDNLAPYGQWVSDPQYGNVWVPNEGGDFRPYGTRGHWVMTDYGNTWVSDDSWGWACYHYGRWTFDPYYGWVWIPGYEWAPAWVSWRYGGGQCGWAPLGPGVSISVGYNRPDSWWVFVAPEYMYHRDCIHYWRGASYNGGYIHQTTIINNYYVDNGTHVRYNYGPRREAIEHDTHQPVQVYKVSQTNRIGAPSESGNRISMYRPAVNRNTVNDARPTNVIQAPRALSSRPQPATTTGNRQPQFRQDLPKLAPQQRQAPQQQTQRQVPQQQPQRQMPQQEPQRQAPQQQPQRQMPQQQPQRQMPQQEPQRQAPQQQPQRQMPQQQPQRQMPQQQPQRQAPQQQPQRQMPQQQPQRQMPQQEPQRQAPQQQPQRQMPQQQPQRQAPQQQPQRQAPPPQQRQEAPHEEGRRR